MNDKLVLDLGGTHRSLGGSVSLDDVAKEQSDFDFFALLSINLFSTNLQTLLLDRRIL